MSMNMIRASKLALITLGQQVLAYGLCLNHLLIQIPNNVNNCYINAHSVHDVQVVFLPLIFFCSLPVTCKNGTLKLGIDLTGHVQTKTKFVRDLSNLPPTTWL